MIQVFNVNPFAEAMLYYRGRANSNERIEKRLAEMVTLYPKHKKAFEKAAAPAAALEKLLDSKLTVDTTLIDKYFKNLDSPNPAPPFGFCIASVMIFCPLINHLDYSIEKMCKYLRECTMEERMFTLCFGITDQYESVDLGESGIEGFIKRVENSQISLENKWKILTVGINYPAHIEEILSLIVPAAKLIRAASATYENVENEFRIRYMQDNAQEIFDSYFELKHKPIGIMNVAPMLFDFRHNFYVMQYCKEDDTGENNSKTNANLTCKMFTGIARHLVNEYPKSGLSELSEKIKALSDNTRLEMLFYLCSHRMYGQELCAKFGLVQSTISYHITKLLTAGLMTAEFVSGKTYYTADKIGIQRMLDAFAEKIK